MDAFWITKQLMDFQKSTFDNTYNAMVMVQDHTEKVANTFFEQVTWFPEESRRLVSQWAGIYKKGRDDLKKALDDHFNTAAALVIDK